MNRTVTIKHERAPTVKKESDIDDVPFESSTVLCGPKSNTNQQEIRITALKEEKEQLIKNLIETKQENQKLYMDIKCKEQTIAVYDDQIVQKEKQISELTHKYQVAILAQEDQKSRSEEEITKQKEIVIQLTRENKTSQAKIKQLMATTCSQNVQKTVDSDEESEAEYEVAAILDHNIKRNKRLFLIRWKNFSPTHDSWEKEDNLNCPKILKNYLGSKGL